MEYKGQQFHENCFLCSTCNTSIGSKSFIPKDNKIFCVPCYENNFATKCTKCVKVNFHFSKLFNCLSIFLIINWKCICWMIWRWFLKVVSLTKICRSTVNASTVQIVNNHWPVSDLLQETITHTVQIALVNSLPRSAIRASSQLQVCIFTLFKQAVS